MRRRSPSPRRYDSPPRRRRSSSPRDRGEAPTSLLVRNISRETRPEDLKGPFQRYGEVKDVYLPKDFRSGEPRGFGFVQFSDPRDALEAQYKMNHQLIKGREVSVVFAEETRKKPSEMRMKESSRDRPSSRRSPRRDRSRSRSPRHRSVSPRRRRYSRSYSPAERRGHGRDRQRSPGRREGHARGRSPPPRRRDSFSSHGRGGMVPGYPPFVPPGAIPRFDMFGHSHAGLMPPPYPPYHRVWGDV